MIDHVAKARTALFSIVVLLAGLLPANADDFIRGDVNGDGWVSISDAHLFWRHLYAGKTIGCLEAADASDDSVINDDDNNYIMSIVWGHPPLAAPSSALGPDLTEPSLGCEDSGGGISFPDVSANAIVRDAVAEGGSRPYAVITLALTHSTGIGGYQFLIRDPSGVVGNYRIGDALYTSLGEEQLERGRELGAAGVAPRRIEGQALEVA